MAPIPKLTPCVKSKAATSDSDSDDDDDDDHNDAGARALCNGHHEVIEGIIPLLDLQSSHIHCAHAKIAAFKYRGFVDIFNKRAPTCSFYRRAKLFALRTSSYKKCFLLHGQISTGQNRLSHSWSLSLVLTALDEVLSLQVS